MKKCVLFPGQGSQKLNMGKDIYDENEDLRWVYDDVSNDEFNLKELIFNSDEETLKQTNITQPTVFACSVLVYELLKKNGIKPEYTGGNSLGEYAGLYAAGILDYKTTFELVKLRGNLMHKASIENPGAMAAVIGLERNELEEILNSISEENNSVECALFNCPGQIVIAGTTEAVKKAIIEIKNKGKKAIPLKVSGAWHSKLMKSAVEEFSKAVLEARMKAPEISFYQNISGKKETEVEKIKQNLILQLTKPVLWIDNVKNMIADGADFFIEAGPGKVLAGLMKKIDNSVKINNVETIEDLNNLKEVITNG